MPIRNLFDDSTQGRLATTFGQSLGQNRIKGPVKSAQDIQDEKDLEKMIAAAQDYQMNDKKTLELSLSKDPRKIKNEDKFPEVPHPWPYNKEPLVIGSPAMARSVQKITKSFPGATDDVKTISTRPDQSVFDYMGPRTPSRGGTKGLMADPELTGGTQLLGLTHWPEKSVEGKDNRPSVWTDPWGDRDPRNSPLPGNYRDANLMHELAHTKGYGETYTTPFSDMLTKARMPPEPNPNAGLDRDRGAIALPEDDAYINRKSKELDDFVKDFDKKNPISVPKKQRLRRKN